MPNSIRICRFKGPYGIRIGVVEGGDTVADLGLATLEPILESSDPKEHVKHLADQTRVSMPLGNLELLPPVDHNWAYWDMMIQRVLAWIFR